MYTLKGEISHPLISGGKGGFLQLRFSARVGWLSLETEQISIPDEDAEKIFGQQFGPEFEGLDHKKITIRIHI